MIIMDCEHCEPLLLDLAYGELSPSVEAELRAHVDGCASCGAALARIESGLSFAQQLPLAAAPAGLEQQLMAAARAQAARVRDQKSIWQLSTAFLARFAMARQVAMAAVFGLIIAVGLWSVPNLSHAPEAAGGTVINPEPDGEAAPSAALQPAKPLDLAMDTRTGRIRSRSEKDEAARVVASARPASAPQPSAAAPSPADDSLAELAKEEPEPRADPNTVVANNADKADERAQSDSAYELARAATESKRANDGERQASSKLSSLGASSGGGRAHSDEGVAQEAKPAREALDKPAVAKGEAYFAPAPPPTPAPSPVVRDVDQVASQAKAKKASVSQGANADDLGDGLGSLSTTVNNSQPHGAVSGASAANASQPGAKTANTSTSAAAGMLATARGQRAANGCSAALGSYRTLIQRYPASAEAGTALSELTACYARLGQDDLANTTLQNALQDPALAPKAKSLLAARRAAPNAAAAPQSLPAKAKPARN